MRCNQAILSAFLVHPRYQHSPALTHLMLEKLGIENARYAQPGVARALVERHSETLVTQQARTGFWKPSSRGNKSHAPAISYYILSGIHQAGMLADIGTATLPLLHDPFIPFAQRDDVYGVLVRRLYKQPLPDDDMIVTRLCNELTSQQREDGSWAGTVVSTALLMIRLIELGLPIDAPAIARGAQWLLTQYRETFPRRKIIANSLFCSENCLAEFASAQRDIPESIPVGACYGHLPFIPTGLALHVLIVAGYADDPRSEASLASLMKLANPVYAEDGVTLHSINGWCAHSCVFLLEEEMKHNAR
ncbi:MAG: hypothetical protein ACYC0V_18620 [Armatimonadota bacterium]